MSEVGSRSGTPESSSLGRYRVSEPTASQVIQLITDEFAPVPASGDSTPSRYLFDRLRVQTLISEANAWAVVRAEPLVWLFAEDGPWKDVQQFSAAMGGGRPVLHIPGEEAYVIREGLPEDTYLIGDSFGWLVALTHETNLSQKRYCLVCR